MGQRAELDKIYYLDFIWSFLRWINFICMIMIIVVAMEGWVAMTHPCVRLRTKTFSNNYKGLDWNCF